MFEKNLSVAFLLDFYSNLLDERTRDIMEAYYEDDLSLSEIADGEGISRQGVRHIVKKGEEQLEFFEEKLGLAEHYEELSLAAKKLEGVKATLLEAGGVSDDTITILEEIISTILNKGI
ncbi:MAG: DNA-binding protein [Clostridia bacterium]|nr:DNA-binding protein [Clostridia bacterium]